jgi:hypothetical protein
MCHVKGPSNENPGVTFRTTIYCHLIDYRRGLELVTGFTKHLQNVTPKFTVNTAHKGLLANFPASVLSFLQGGDCLTTNSLLQLSCLYHLGTDRTENTSPLLLFLTVAVQRACLRSRYSVTAIV